MATIFSSPWPAATRSGRCGSTVLRSAPTPATAARTSSTARCCPSRPISRASPPSRSPAAWPATASGSTWPTAKGSSIRAVPLNPRAEVRTVVGTSQLPVARLFTFGDVDGPAAKARFQHPLGVAFHDGRIYVADTYNNKIRVVDPSDGTTRTLAGTGQRRPCRPARGVFRAGRAGRGGGQALRGRYEQSPHSRDRSEDLAGIDAGDRRPEAAAAARSGGKAAGRKRRETAARGRPCRTWRNPAPRGTGVSARATRSTPWRRWNIVLRMPSRRMRRSGGHRPRRFWQARPGREAGGRIRDSPAGQRAVGAGCRSSRGGVLLLPRRVRGDLQDRQRGVDRALGVIGHRRAIGHPLAASREVT